MRGSRKVRPEAGRDEEKDGRGLRHWLKPSNLHSYLARNAIAPPGSRDRNRESSHLDAFCFRRHHSITSIAHLGPRAGACIPIPSQVLCHRKHYATRESIGDWGSDFFLEIQCKARERAANIGARTGFRKSLTVTTRLTCGPYIGSTERFSR